VRWYFKARGRDGAQVTRRGFLSKKTAIQAKRRLVEQVVRGEATYGQMTFAEYWEHWIERRRYHLAKASVAAYTSDARMRLLPVLGEITLQAIDSTQIRDLADGLAQRVEASEISGKTVNNTLTTLTVCLNAAVEDGLIAANPAIGAPRFPRAHVERDYLRLHEIPVYLESCNDQYRPLAALLIGTGARISEALALRARDLELDATGGWVLVARTIRLDGTFGSTKSRRPRSVEIGPTLAQLLKAYLAERQRKHPGASADAPLFITPSRGHPRHGYPRKRTRELLAPGRRIVSEEWHPHALEDAGLRHMPLHSLRHTAAAAWLAAGNSLLYVHKQLGHMDLVTTSSYYGHLERHHNPTRGAHATEQAIINASQRRARLRRAKRKPAE
jgi:integrase